VKFLVLIHLDEARMAAMPAREMSDLNARHLTFNDELRASGHFVEAEALEPASTRATLRLGQSRGRERVVDGPFAEAKEVVAGFYLLEARDLAEATAIAARIPSAHLGTIEVWPTRQLVVD
jgi:hypothetical protein